MNKKVDVKRKLQIHSQAKVEFYEKYLSRYLRILCLAKHISKVKIYDVFCGMGIYENGGKGSPIVAFDTIKTIFEENILNNTQVSLNINDKSEDCIKRVQNYTDKNNKGFCIINCYNKDIGEMFNVVQQEVSKTPTDTRNLIFIDPYGYKDISKEQLFNLMENGKTEIILFLPISHMQRFTQKAIIDEETAQYEPLRRFVNSFFPANLKTRKERIPVMEYIQYITEALKCSDRFFATSYYIERDTTTHFALFFISSHIFGFEKILEVKWQLDDEAGRGFKIPQPQGLFDEQFAEEAKNKNAEKLETILQQCLSESKTNKEIYKITLENEFLPKHTTEIFEKWQKTNYKFKVYDLKTGKEARKKSFYISWENYKETTDKVKFIIEGQ
jgi:three-Cys-motif partner protein